MAVTQFMTCSLGAGTMTNLSTAESVTYIRDNQTDVTSFSLNKSFILKEVFLCSHTHIICSFMDWEVSFR